eukprot:CAMPEP_0183546028 /NCGR_PEP_ID=MMETSP0371-20130417/51999_1 /TAXON_ID=268820 /ORGANISM="Peridinium aciculiferum, Strain PAER-2" /LENGTH=59 /DNA_ID=CAMNT_0025748413 /DNA_START=48 /DNA_END=224 /DNA_ORIENTATION=+
MPTNEGSSTASHARSSTRADKRLAMQGPETEPRQPGKNSDIGAARQRRSAALARSALPN